MNKKNLVTESQDNIRFPATGAISAVLTEGY